MKDLRKTFYNPPQGGNGHGVQTSNPMADYRDDQTTLRQTFEAGRSSASNNQLHSGRAAQPEFRNYTRGDRLPQEPGDPSANMAYDFEADHTGRGKALEPVMQRGEPGGQVRPVPVPAALSYRTDGKPNNTMGRQAPDSDGMGAAQAPEPPGNQGLDDNPAKSLGRNPGYKAPKGVEAPELSKHEMHAREQMSPKNMAIPGKNKYKINDRQHAASALGFAKMHHAGTAEEAKVKAAVYGKFPDMKKEGGK